MPKPGPAPRTRRDGCGFTIGTCVFTCLLLVLNGLIVTALYQWAFPNGPTAMMQRLKAAQVIMFVGPVLLLFLQWTLLDFGIRRMLFARRKKSDE